jgi:hypothetical protein
MHKRLSRNWLLVTGIAFIGLALVVTVADRVGRVPIRHDVVNADAFLSAAPPQGRWGDPHAGARWEQGRREIGIALSHGEKLGPVRCALRIVPGAAARHEPDLEVELTNTSDNVVLLNIHRDLLDVVTFILRDPDDEILSSFSYFTVHSSTESKPPIVLMPGASKTRQVHLSVAADHGFQPLRPGVYSLEAVFRQPPMLSRSNRLAIRVENIDKRTEPGGAP